jgi:hypothetical protein
MRDICIHTRIDNPDCEVFWSAAAEDFSFFGSAGVEKCSVPESELRGVVPLGAQMGKMVVGESAGGGGMNRAGHAGRGGRGGTVGEAVDVLHEIWTLRREKKAAHQGAVEQGWWICSSRGSGKVTLR